MLGFKATDDYARAREALQRTGYTDAGIRQTVGRDQILAMPPTDVPRVLRRTRALSPLDTLVRLFFLGLPVPQDAARRALRPLPLDGWVQAEVLDPPGPENQVTPRVQIWPVCGMMMAVDLPWRQPNSPVADFVMPPGPVTLELVHAMIHRPCQRVLDLGTGSGMLALAAAPDAEAVVATDTNPRALVFARFNACLNQVPKVHCLAGSLFEPVAAERFQLIVCNPPFVISPDRGYQFRDSGERGDEFCRRLVHGAAEHLDPGGFLQCTVHVPVRTGHSWKADRRSGSACLDVLARRAHQTPPTMPELDPRPRRRTRRWSATLPGLDRVPRAPRDRGHRPGADHAAQVSDRPRLDPDRRSALPGRWALRSGTPAVLRVTDGVVRPGKGRGVA